MKLVVVSQNGCNPCTMVKNFLTNEEVKYFIFNLSIQESIEINGAKYNKEDFMGTPVTLLIDEDGEEIARVNGFSPPQLQVLIDQLS